MEGRIPLLREDAVVTPWPHWYRGHAAIRAFFNWLWPRGRLRADHLRLVPLAANAQPAFVLYRPVDERELLEASVGRRPMGIAACAMACYAQAVLCEDVGGQRRPRGPQPVRLPELPAQQRGSRPADVRAWSRAGRTGRRPVYPRKCVKAAIAPRRTVST